MLYTLLGDSIEKHDSNIYNYILNLSFLFCFGVSGIEPEIQVIKKRNLKKHYKKSQAVPNTARDLLLFLIFGNQLPDFFTNEQYVFRIFITVKVGVESRWFKQF